MAMTARVDDFHCLESRLRLTGVLRAVTALRIGAAGGDLDGVDLPVIKDAAGVPFCPGAGLKGVLRSTVEALLRGAESRPAGLWACDPLEDTDGPHRSCGHHERGTRSSVQLDEHCAVCRLFGSHLVASHVRFCDAPMRLSEHDRKLNRIPVEVRDGVSIDRDLRRARGARKFDFEVVSPGAEFALEIFVENPQPWLMGLVVMGFDQLAEGFAALGGFTSRGLGRVSFTWSSIVRVTAGALLRGDPPVTTTGDAVAAQMRAWRDALAVKYRAAA
jgi:CRISPR-associated RAMP protein (TIGR02581 family)